MIRKINFRWNPRQLMAAHDLVDNELNIGAVEHPAGYAVVRASVDWRRAGIERPLPRDALEDPFGCYTRLKHARSVPEQVDDALDWALRSLNHTVALVTDEGTGYRALDLVMDRLAATSSPPPPELWATVLALAAAEELGEIGYRAYDLEATGAARTAWQKAAAAGDTGAMSNLGVLLADQLDPPDLTGARTCWEQVAAAGDSGASAALRVLEDIEGHER